MKTALVFHLMLVFFLSAGIHNAQSVSPQVISSAGDDFRSREGIRLHWTLGEPMVETYRPGGILTQGFHQLYFDLLVTGRLFRAPGMAIQVFPNPTDGPLTVHMEGIDPGLSVILYGMDGISRRIWTWRSESLEMDLSGEPPGNYILVILDGDTVLFSQKIIRSH